MAHMADMQLVGIVRPDQTSANFLMLCTPTLSSSKLSSRLPSSSNAYFLPHPPIPVLRAYARVALGLAPPRPSVAFAYGFGRARVPSPSDSDFPAAFPRCVAKSSRPGRPSPRTHHTLLSIHPLSSRSLSRAGAKHRPPSHLPSRDRS
ncbi:hypothetical protein GGX14DRAFT_576296 [Mycena pura]|uniref:Uncharacterized protein n=1 Tax=Mycena pura TaxID=153505 RepID=A0AAD6UU60_9AGAR|nr:hypothetical protein GGX14DRAFT_576296 [Mycena pura]